MIGCLPLLELGYQLQLLAVDGFRLHMDQIKLAFLLRLDITRIELESVLRFLLDR